MKVLIVSDFHLGKGEFFKSGQKNILEDFSEDQKFIEFLEYYSSGTNYLSKVHLILNGDILNLIQVDMDGVFTTIVDEEHTVHAIEKIVEGHRVFFDALKSFLSKPNKKITYVIGNHDAGMAFDQAQQALKEYIGENLSFCFDVQIEGVHIEHGHRFEINNATPVNRYFIEGPLGKKILNLPWGSLFCISLLPRLKKERPYIDKIRPMSTYIKWCIFHDPFFFVKLISEVLKYFIMTSFATYTRQNANFKTTIKLLKQITIYPKYGKKAKAILKSNPNIHTVIMGHTHLVEWRKYPENKYYFNTGTWNPIPSLDASRYLDVVKLSYVMIDFAGKKNVVKEIALKQWIGSWKPFRDEISVPS